MHIRKCLLSDHMDKSCGHAEGKRGEKKEENELFLIG